MELSATKPELARASSLASLKRGEEGVVATVGTENKALCNRLLSMGLVTGTSVKVLQIAPLGDPIKIEALGYKLSLRRDEAETVVLEAK